MALVAIYSGSTKVLQDSGDLAAGINCQDLLTHVCMQPGASHLVFAAASNFFLASFSVLLSKKDVADRYTTCSQIHLLWLCTAPGIKCSSTVCHRQAATACSCYFYRQSCLLCTGETILVGIPEAHPERQHS